VLYFAYGSDLWQPRLEFRVGPVRAFGVARLAGYTLRWNKRSTDGSGKCDIVPAERGEVIGVVYEMDEAKVAVLDRIEGVGAGYDRADLRVELNGEPVTACAYIATQVDDTLLPYDWYRHLVLAGARQHRLPADYIARIGNQRFRIDPDGDRRFIDQEEAAFRRVLAKQDGYQ
jgi:cation transport regulator ChaC